jgi:hypothetical protein
MLPKYLRIHDRKRRDLLPLGHLENGIDQRTQNLAIRSRKERLVGLLLEFFDFF